MNNSFDQFIPGDVMFSIGKRSACIFDKLKENPKYSVVLDINGFTQQINTDSVDFYSRVLTNYKQFCTADKPANYHVNVAEYNHKVKRRLRGDANYNCSKIQLNEVFNYRMDRSGTHIDLMLPKQYEPWMADNFFKLYFSSRCLDHGMILFHASAIIKTDGGMVVFLGQSGAGKSTIASLSDLPCIHDDIIAISCKQGRFRVETIPFKVDYEKRAFDGAIDGFFRIYQSSKTYSEKISHKVEKQTHLLFGVWSFREFDFDSGSMDQRKIEMCQAMIDIPMKRLFFTKNKEFMKLI
ncbi:hypothetical protein QQ008_07085 [Fulvivirgaceae bacterium BMA10]|uniref:Uncharacterized protein n=1 Tax=Splendidivirga corallicola TaxID=3051826 RepID=A0ABT8KK76_9BACT|nr:hypothetical protein [Fulvivirgaceae bacterium BMA10]